MGRLGLLLLVVALLQVSSAAIQYGGAGAYTPDRLTAVQLPARRVLLAHKRLVCCEDEERWSPPGCRGPLRPCPP